MFQNSYNRGPKSRGSSFSRGSNFGRRPMQSARPRFRGSYISPDKFINKGVVLQSQAPYTPTHQFSDFGLDGALLRNVRAHNYQTPTPIQDQAIVPISEGRDFVGLANTGTGKTAAFLLPIINRLLNNQCRGTVLIIVPTRELAIQIDQEWRAFTYGLRLYSCVCVGGANMQRQISNLFRNPQVVIGTPGRLKDLQTRGFLKLEFVSILVLDEADRMLDMGFSKDINHLVDLIPTERQTLCFSATTSPNIQLLINKIVKDAVTVSVKSTETSDHIDQDVVEYETAEHKLELLLGMMGRGAFEKVLIFGETKHGVQRLSEKLIEKGVSAEAIHGNKSQPQRQRALAAFKNNVVRALVATDVAARGLDIPNVSHVINFDQPNNYDDYIHRIGRTGRAGKSGNALTFIPKR